MTVIERTTVRVPFRRITELDREFAPRTVELIASRAQVEKGSRFIRRKPTFTTGGLGR